MRNTAGNKKKAEPIEQPKQPEADPRQQSIEDFLSEFEDSPGEGSPADAQEPAVDTFQEQVEDKVEEPTADESESPSTSLEGQTKGGRDIIISRTRDGRFFEIKFNGGGELAPELQGLFTSFNNAQWAVNLYKQRKGL